MNGIAIWVALWFPLLYGLCCAPFGIAVWFVFLFCGLASLPYISVYGLVSFAVRFMFYSLCCDTFHIPVQYGLCCGTGFEVAWFALVYGLCWDVVCVAVQFPLHFSFTRGSS